MIMVPLKKIFCGKISESIKMILKVIQNVMTILTKSFYFVFFINVKGDI